MPRLSSNTITTSRGRVRLTKRANSQKWQCHFKIDGRWVRLSTGCEDREAALDRAEELLLEYRIRAQNKVPTVSKRFKDVAAMAIAEMDRKATLGGGKTTFADYKSALNRYLIPYFGDKAIGSIDQDALAKLVRRREKWLTQQRLI